MSKFALADLVKLQTLVFPVVEMLGGPSIPDLMTAGAEPVKATGHVLHQVAEIFDVAGAALDDGRLTMDEINAVIAEAGDVPLAIEALRAKVKALGGEETAG